MDVLDVVGARPAFNACKSVFADPSARVVSHRDAENDVQLCERQASLGGLRGDQQIPEYLDLLEGSTVQDGLRTP